MLCKGVECVPVRGFVSCGCFLDHEPIHVKIRGARFKDLYLYLGPQPILKSSEK